VLQNRRNLLLYAGGAAAGVAALSLVLGRGEQPAGVSAQDKATIGKSTRYLHRSNGNISSC
jgi:hypothetical protein